MRVLTQVQLTAYDVAGSTPVTLLPTTLTYGGRVGGRAARLRLRIRHVYTFPIATGETTRDVYMGFLTHDDARAGRRRKRDGRRSPNRSARRGRMLPRGSRDRRAPLGERFVPYERRLRTASETCSANLQLAREPNNASRGIASCFDPQQMNSASLIDMNGDGLPELVTQLSYVGMDFDPSLNAQLQENIDPSRTSDYPACSLMPPPPCTDSTGAPTACIFDSVQGLIGPWAMGTSTNDLVTDGNGPNQICATVPDMHCGWYMLRVYENLGNGEFSNIPRVVYSPVPLDTVDHTSTRDDGELAGATYYHSFIDIDGDARMDAIYQLPSSSAYWVWRGDGEGGFLPQQLTWSAQVGGIDVTSTGTYVTDQVPTSAAVRRGAG